MREGRVVELRAVESGRDILRSMKDFSAKFSENGLDIPGLPGGATWHERLGIWGHFSATAAKTPPERYWNVFGKQPTRLRQSMLVEINPAKQGKNLNRQGLVATDSSGNRWVLHQGRLHPSKLRITETIFDQVANAARVNVTFSDGTVAPCHLITNLDASATRVQDDVARFIDLCDRARRRFLLGETAAAAIQRVIEAEGQPSPERQGSYAVPARAARIAERRHGDIYHAFVACLEGMNITTHSNGRIGRYGPDLFVKSSPDWLLFELKADLAASDIQQALGQLQLYELLLKHKCLKVMVLPGDPPPVIGKALKALKIEILKFTRIGRKITIDAAALKALATSPA